MVTEEKIDMILEWADEHPEFDAEFVEDLQDKFETYGRLTENQEAALDNIIEKWGIE